MLEEPTDHLPADGAGAQDGDPQRPAHPGDLHAFGMIEMVADGRHGRPVARGLGYTPGT